MSSEVMKSESHDETIEWAENKFGDTNELTQILKSQFVNYRGCRPIVEP